MRSLGIVSLLIKSGALEDQLCQGKWTAMHEVARLGCGHLAMLLLRAGASVSQKDRHGVTPLGVAAQHGQLETLDMLICYGKVIMYRPVHQNAKNHLMLIQHQQVGHHKISI